MNFDKILELIKSIKDNPTVLVTIVFASIGTIASGSYIAITKYNEISSMISSYDDTAGDASSAKRRVETLEKRVQEQQETIIRIQERLSEALINSKEAKIMAESTQKEARASANAQKVELDATAQAIKSEMNSLKKATTNRLGN